MGFVQKRHHVENCCIEFQRLFLVFFQEHFPGQEPFRRLLLYPVIFLRETLVLSTIILLLLIPKQKLNTIENGWTTSTKRIWMLGSCTSVSTIFMEMTAPKPEVVA